jgi:hypothetical protein
VGNDHVSGVSKQKNLLEAKLLQEAYERRVKPGVRRREHASGLFLFRKFRRSVSRKARYASESETLPLSPERS